MQKLKPVPKVAVEMRTPTALERYLPVGCAPSMPESGSVLATASSCRVQLGLGLILQDTLKLEGCGPSVPEYGSVLATASSCRSHFTDRAELLPAHAQCMPRQQLRRSALAAQHAAGP